MPVLATLAADKTDYSVLRFASAIRMPVRPSTVAAARCYPGAERLIRIPPLNIDFGGRDCAAAVVAARDQNRIVVRDAYNQHAAIG